MTMRKAAIGAGAVALMAVSLGIALGEPPPKEPPLPGLIGGPAVMWGPTFGNPAPKKPPHLVFAKGKSGDLNVGSD